MKIQRKYLRTAGLVGAALITGHLMQNADGIMAAVGLRSQDAARDEARSGDPQVLVAALSTPRTGTDAALAYVPGSDDPGTPPSAAPAALVDPVHGASAAARAPAPAAPTTAAPTTAATTAAQSLSLARATPAAAPSLIVPVSAAAGELSAAPLGLAQATPSPAADEAAGAASCGPVVAVNATAGAMLHLDIADPCAADAPVTVAHAGLTVSGRTDAAGLLSLDLPALESPARVTVSVAGASTEGSAEVPDLAQVDRVAVTWTGPAALELHAYEYGAGFSDPGHVWAGAPHDLADLTAGSGGLLQVLDGTGPQHAQVYTFPAGHAARAGDIRLSLEAQVTKDACGIPVKATALTTRPGAAPQAVPVDLDMPGCDAVGTYLALDGLFPGLKVAAN